VCVRGRRTRWGTSTSVCCSHVYATSHMFVKTSGAAYSAITLKEPNLAAAAQRPAAMATTPRPDWKTFLGHLPGHSAFEKGKPGMKWLETPYLGPPVAPKSR
jgi:hypothetical protein